MLGARRVHLGAELGHVLRGIFRLRDATFEHQIGQLDMADVDGEVGVLLLLDRGLPALDEAAQRVRLGELRQQRSGGTPLAVQVGEVQVFERCVGNTLDADAAHVHHGAHHRALQALQFIALVLGQLLRWLLGAERRLLRFECRDAGLVFPHLVHFGIRVGDLPRQLLGCLAVRAALFVVARRCLGLVLALQARRQALGRDFERSEVRIHRAAAADIQVFDHHRFDIAAAAGADAAELERAQRHVHLHATGRLQDVVAQLLARPGRADHVDRRTHAGRAAHRKQQDVREQAAHAIDQQAIARLAQLAHVLAGGLDHQAQPAQVELVDRLDVVGRDQHQVVDFGLADGDLDHVELVLRRLGRVAQRHIDVAQVDAASADGLTGQRVVDCGNRQVVGLQLEHAEVAVPLHVGEVDALLAALRLGAFHAELVEVLEARSEEGAAGDVLEFGEVQAGPAERGGAGLDVLAAEDEVEPADDLLVDPAEVAFVPERVAFDQLAVRAHARGLVALGIHGVRVVELVHLGHRENVVVRVALFRVEAALRLREHPVVVACRERHAHHAAQAHRVGPDVVDHQLREQGIAVAAVLAALVDVGGCRIELRHRHVGPDLAPAGAVVVFHDGPARTRRHRAHELVGEVGLLAVDVREKARDGVDEQADDRRLDIDFVRQLEHRLDALVARPHHQQLQEDAPLRGSLVVQRLHRHLVDQLLQVVLVFAVLVGIAFLLVVVRDQAVGDEAQRRFVVRVGQQLVEDAQRVVVGHDP